MKFFLTVICFLVAITLFSQTKKNRVQYIINVGSPWAIPFNNIIESPFGIEEDEIKVTSQLGYFIEALAIVDINNKTIFQAGLNFNQKHFVKNESLGLLDSDLKIKSSYVDLPIMVGYKIIDYFVPIWCFRLIILLFSIKSILQLFFADLIQVL